MLAPLVAAVAIVAVTSIRVARAIRQQRRLRATMPTIRIADVVPGRRVKVRGRVELLGPGLHGPVSGRACAGFSATLYEPRGDSDNPWRRVLVDDDVEPFLVRDDSGAAVVKPRKRDVVWSIDVVRDGSDATTPRRWEEAALVPGQVVSVVGMARLEPDPSGPASYREMATRPVFDSTLPSPLFIVDDER